MKLDKEFAVRVNGKLFTANEIFKFNIDGTKFNMTCYCGSGSVFDVTARTRDVEFVSVPQIPKPAHGGDIHVDEVVTKNLWNETVSYKEIVTPLEEVGHALIEAVKTITENQQRHV